MNMSLNDWYAIYSSWQWQTTSYVTKTGVFITLVPLTKDMVTGITYIFTFPAFMCVSALSFDQVKLLASHDTETRKVMNNAFRNYYKF